MTQNAAPRVRPLLAIAGFSGAIFLLEVLLTRIYSVTLYHHFAFVAVSVGMLGLAASGVRVALAPERFTAESAPRDIPAAGLRFAISTLIAVALLVQVGLSPKYTWLRAVAILFIYAVSFVPFYFGGIAVTLLLTHNRGKFASLYATDLMAAGLGGLLVVPLLGAIGGPSGVAAAALLAAVASIAAFPDPEPRLRKNARIVAGLCVLAIVGDQSLGLLRVRRPKEQEQGTVLYEAWNALSRVAVYDTPMQPWAVGPKYKGQIPAGIQMDIDASAATPILSSDASASDYLRYELTAAAYAVAPIGHSLVIGAGGGRDVLTGLIFGAKNVDAVEINPIIANDVMRGRFLKMSGGVYVDPRVNVHVGDGRTFVRRSADKFDVIQLSLVDTWAATAAGAFALSENNLYTQQAIGEYIDHLNPDGVLTLIRWSGADIYRMIVMVEAAARAAGIQDPARHIAIVECPHTPEPSISVANLLFRKSPFDAETVARLAVKADEAGFTFAHDPLRPLPGRTSEITRAADPVAEAGKTEFYELRPSTDDWPFFFYRPRPSFFGGIIESPRRLYTEGPYLVAEILLLALVLGFCCLLLPLWKRGREALRTDPRTTMLGGLYYVCLGMGFMFIEVSMMQRFVLYLGHPTYTLTAVMAGLLVGAGFGSGIAGRLRKGGANSYAMPIGALVAGGVIIGSGVIHPAVFESTQHLGFYTKIGITELLVLPIGAALGTLMPLGISSLSERTPALVPWAWSVNGFASVIGSCVAALLSMTYGFTVTFRLGAACYVFAAIAALAFRTQAPAGAVASSA